jgi:hypothetical protein
MRTIPKLALAVAAATALAGSAQAQNSPFAPGDVILGFTTSTSTGDLVIDLGSLSQVGIGVPGGATTDLITGGQAGFTGTGLANALTLNGLSQNVTWGVVTGLKVNALNSHYYATVPHGAAAPPFSGVNPGGAIAAIGTAGAAVDGTATPANSGVVDPTAALGGSFTEAITSGSVNSFKTSAKFNPTTSTGTTGAYSSVEDLWLINQINGVFSEAFAGTFTLGFNGTTANTLTFTAAVPEPGTYGLFAGAGLLALSLRRQLTRKAN